MKIKKIDSYIGIILFWYIVFFLIIIFEEKINILASKCLLYWNPDDIFSKISFSLIVLLAGYFLMRRIKILNLSLLLNAVCVCIIYSLFRFNVIEHTAWDFVPVKGIMKYADAVFVLPIISIIPCIAKFVEKLEDKRKYNSNVDTPSFEISDNNAVGLEADDLFGYAKDAENLLKMLVKNKKRTEKGSVIIGLNGEWGKGKTSYLNLMRNYADTRHDVILIRINVWQSHSYEDMAKKLLSAIANGINDISLKNLINDYSKAIIDADISVLSKLVRLLSIGKPRQPEELFNIVSEKIKDLNKCLIIQVDDIDRLTGAEILYTLKFIRNIASFRNTFVIVAYDEEYLKQQFCELKINASYLEKIFNVIYPLPAVRKEDYTDIVKNELVNSLMIDADVKKVIDEFLEIIDENISLRNAKRLASSIQCGLSMLKDEDGKIMIDLLDYILIQYLQQINPKAYDFLSSFKDDTSFIKNRCITLRGLIYVINKENGFGTDKKELSDEEYKKNRLSKDVGEENIELTFRIFKKMFDYNRDTVLGVSYANSFPLYFKRTFDKKLIKKKDFLNSAKSGSEAFSKDIKQWYDNYDRFTLNNLIAAYRCNTKEEWLQFFESIMEITPRSYLEFMYNNMGNWNFIPTPGLGIIKERDRINVEVLNKAIDIFFFDNKILESDSLEILQKKFVLLIYNGKYHNYAYTIKSKFSDRAIFELYWNIYWKKGGSYNDFDEDLWFFIEEFLNFGDKLDMREVAIDHIKENIDSFIENYPIKDIANYYALQSLFTEYVVNGNSASGSNEWISKFSTFLNSIENKSELILGYIDGFREYKNNGRTTNL